ncbi:MAG: metalloregulator ArsR/SmtB family transcription factor [Methanocellales archaeon]|nr:metalloregulator ArsR/SmtB family transcription factor [Methanocellales archaeon]
MSTKEVSMCPPDVPPATLKKVRESMSEDVRNITSVLKILSDPIRLHILKALEIEDLCVCILVEITGYQYSVLSYHLKLLKDADLVDSERDGNFLIYHLTAKGKKVLKSIGHMK